MTRQNAKRPLCCDMDPVRRLCLDRSMKLGWKTDLKLKPLLERADLPLDEIQRVNLLNGWRVVRCINRKRTG
mgnify:CR=1 FL=1